MNTKKQNIRSLKEIHQRFSDKVNLSGLAEGEKVEERNLSDVEVTSLVTDSRRVTPGSAFFAIRGLRTNGEDFIEDAVERGAKALIGENINLEENPGVAKIQVKDSRRALAKMAKRYHGSPDESINIVGITAPIS